MPEDVPEPTAAPGEGAAPASYEQARAELEDVVRRLEAGGISLEESLGLWERGEHLARVCQEFLDGARRRLAAAHPDAPGGPEHAGRS